MPDDSSVPTSAMEDRHYLCLTIPEYQNFSEAVNTNCFLDRHGNHVKIKKAKIKKLKNIRHSIKKTPYFMKSMIWRALLERLNEEIDNRELGPHRRRPV